ncbi:MAG: protein kinase [Myxococcales bacterium]|nr:protein kinase [Myxococcales bacterium]
MDRVLDRQAHCESCELTIGGASAAGPGTLVDGRYRLLRQVGDGAMGQVFEALDVHLERRVALKIVHPALGSSLDFEREAKALASVHHRNVPVIHVFGVHGAASFFVMELIEGLRLSEVILQHREHQARMPPFRAVQIVHQLALALAETHAKDIVHRDVKPENVIIERGTGRPVLVDFGVAVRLDPTDTLTVRGSPAFMAPEVLQGGPASPASDLYSLACLAYEVICGVLPFEASSLDELVDAHLRRAVPPPSMHAAELEPFDEVLLRALDKDPRRRYSTCTAFAAALERVEVTEEEVADADVSQLIPLRRGAIRILVVDDDPVFGRVAKRAAMVAFADAEVEVSRAKNGAAAVRNSERVIPQLLLLDYMLPGMDGVEVLSRIRALPGGESVSVVVMSGSVDEQQRWRFSSLGVHDFLEKPVEFSSLVETIVKKGRERGWLSRMPAAE